MSHFSCFAISVLFYGANVNVNVNVIRSEDEWGDLECLYKACQAAITEGGLFTDTGVNERGENKRQS